MDSNRESPWHPWHPASVPWSLPHVVGIWQLRQFAAAARGEAPESSAVYLTSTYVYPSNICVAQIESETCHNVACMEHMH